MYAFTTRYLTDVVGSGYHWCCVCRRQPRAVYFFRRQLLLVHTDLGYNISPYLCIVIRYGMSVIAHRKSEPSIISQHSVKWHIRAVKGLIGTTLEISRKAAGLQRDIPAETVPFCLIRIHPHGHCFMSVNNVLYICWSSQVQKRKFSVVPMILLCLRVPPWPWTWIEFKNSPPNIARFIGLIQVPAIAVIVLSSSSFGSTA